MNEEEKEAIEILKTFEFRRKTKNYNKISLEDSQSVGIVLNYIDKQEKIIDSLAQWVSNLSPMVDKQAVKDIIYKENKYE